tara:strand:+ start:321 stop:1364 length:1044 start_codon:yes stop_codon:yes gene_type:complete
MKILITGSSGFLGEELCYFFLKKKNSLFGLDVSTPSKQFKNKTKFKFSYCDLTNKNSTTKIFNKIRPDIVIHCAAKILEENNKKKIWDLNYNTTKHLLKLSNNLRVKKFIFISTFSIFEENYNKPINEKQKPSYTTLYGETKYRSEIAIMNSSINKKSVILRCPIIIGKKRSYRLGVLTEMIYKNLNIPLIGDGSNKLSVVHVDDISNAIELLIKKNKFGIFNVSSDDRLSVYELLEKFIFSVKSKTKIIKFNRNLGEFLFYFAVKIKIIPFVNYHIKLFKYSVILDTNKLKKSTGWKPKYTILKMLKENFNYFKKGIKIQNQNSFSMKKAYSTILFFFSKYFLSIF